MDTRPSPASGFLDAARAFGAALLRTAHDRIELLALDLEAEKLRLVRVLVWSSVAVFAGVMLTLSASLTLVYLFWESARLWVLVGLTAFYGIAFAAAATVVRRLFVLQPRPFAATLDELKQDRTCLLPKD